MSVLDDTHANSTNHGVIHRYRDRLPVPSEARIVTLHEGNTPLLPLDNIAAEIGCSINLYAKVEGVNPTGSFKDRGMTVAVTQAVTTGSQAIICASTGNTSASAAAYAARAGIHCFVVIPDSDVALGKLAQAMMHGATVIQIQGNFDEGLRIVRTIAEHAPVTIVNSVNPFRLHGQKTAAFEIVDELDRAPDYHCIPVGNAGNISAYWLGYSEYAGKPHGINVPTNFPFRTNPGASGSRPAMLGFQAKGAAPFIRGRKVENPKTVASAIRIGDPQSWEFAWAAQRESSGWFSAYDDDAILEAQRLLADREGIFCEPASAISLAGAIDAIKSGRIRDGSTVVCTVTGHGLKDAEIVSAHPLQPSERVPAVAEEVSRVILAQI